MPPSPQPDAAAPASQVCRACGKGRPAGGKYCPACGAYREPAAEKWRELRRFESNWREVRGTILFYLAILAPIMALVFVPEDEMALGIIIVSLIDAGIIALYWAISRTGLTPQLELSPAAIRWTALALTAVLPLLAINYAYHWLMVRYLGISLYDYTEAFAGAYPAWVLVLVVCVMPAIWEEISFRGIIQTKLGRVVKEREAVLLTAILFSVIHRSVFSGLYLFLVGLFLGGLKRRSGSLVPCMVAHFAHNLAVIVFANT